MKYTIVQECDDGRSYCLIERDDGSTFGQLVDLRCAADDGEVDDLVRQAVETAEATAALQATINAPKVVRVGRERQLPPTQ